MVELSLYDALAIASIIGIIGGVLGVLWKPSSTITSVKKLETKRNLLGLMSAILVFNSLALPWWVFAQWYTDQILLFPWGAETTPSLWIAMGNYALAIYVALAFVLLSGFLGLMGSWVVGNTGKILLVAAAVFAVLSVVIFAGGVESFLARAYLHLFYTNPVVFAYLSFGFWVALVAAILAFIASLRHPTALSATPLS